MSADDQHFLDLLSTIPHDVKQYSLELADAIDTSIDNIALFFRETLQSQTWLPEAARPAPSKLQLSRVPIRAPGPRTYIGYAKEWISEHQAWTAALLAFVGTGGFLLYQRRNFVRKRRAKRMGNGVKNQVVVVAGSPEQPIPRSIVLDLERRGFVVYVTVGSAVEEDMVKREGNNDIQPLYLNLGDPLDLQNTIEKFNRLLTTPQSISTNQPPQDLTFAGLILIPNSTYPIGPVESISPDIWFEALDAKVRQTVTLAQAFLPTVVSCKARILILTPTIMSSLRPPFHGVESAVVGALEGFASSLRGELAPLGVQVCHLKLGSFDDGRFASRQQLQRSERADVLSWSTAVRMNYASNYIAQGLSRDGQAHALKASPLRELNNAVFDSLTQARPRNIWRVGRGSLIYELVGTWVPPGLVGLIMGVRRVELANYELHQDRGMQDSVQWEKINRMT